MAADPSPLQRYKFHRGALALINASYYAPDEHTYLPEAAHVESLELLRQQAVARGFEVVGQLGINPSTKRGPTAQELREFVDRLAQMDFSEYDAFWLVVASHGHEGSLDLWPDPDHPSLPRSISLRDDVFTKFQVAQQGQLLMAYVPEGTPAAKTLVGKPKLFVVDACREATPGRESRVEDPLAAPRFQPLTDDGVVFDRLIANDYYVPLRDADGEVTTRHSDFCFSFSTVPFNQAGVSVDSNFLTPLAEQLRDFPQHHYLEQLAGANGAMQRRHANAGKVRGTCFPQCAEIKMCTLTKPLRFVIPDVATPDGAAAWLADLFDTSRHIHGAGSDAAYELEQKRRELCLIMRQYEQMSKQAAAAPLTRGDGPDSVMDLQLSALGEELVKFASMVRGGEPASGGTAFGRDEAYRMCRQLDGSRLRKLADQLTPPLRGRLDEIASSPQADAAELALLHPSLQHQSTTRGLARTRDLSIDAMEDVDDAAATDGGGSASAVSSSWTAVQSGEKLLFRLARLQRGFCYLFHLNERDQLSVVFPSKRDPDNEVRSPGAELQLPRRFHEGERLRYLSFETNHGLERETFYLLTTSRRLTAFEGVGELPDQFQKLPHRQSQSILGMLRRYVGSGRAPQTRDLSAEAMADDMDVSDASAEEPTSMSLCRLMLVSVARPQL